MLITQSPESRPIPWLHQGVHEWVDPNGTTIDVYRSGVRAELIYSAAVTCDEHDEQYVLELFADALDSGALFNRFVEKWRTERGVSSSTTELILNRNYQSIIGMGQKAIPLILAQMESEGDDPDQWFFALQVLTGANPVPEEDDGDFQAMARAWIQWARRRYIW